MLGRFRLVAAAGHTILGVLMALTAALPANAKPLDIFRDCDACPEMMNCL